MNRKQLYDGTRCVHVCVCVCGSGEKETERNIGVYEISVRLL